MAWLVYNAMTQEVNNRPQYVVSSDQMLHNSMNIITSVILSAIQQSPSMQPSFKNVVMGSLLHFFLFVCLVLWDGVPIITYSDLSRHCGWKPFQPNNDCNHPKTVWPGNHYLILKLHSGHQEMVLSFLCTRISHSPKIFCCTKCEVPGIDSSS